MSEQSTVVDASYETSRIRELAKSSVDFLAGLVMPTVYQFAFPVVYLAIWDFLCQNVAQVRTFPQLAIGLPRGFAKTTLMKIFIFYCIVFTKKEFFLIVSDTATKAENIISDIVDMLSESNVKKIFGDWRLGIEKDTQSLKKFGFCGRNIILLGIGAGTSLRGYNIKNSRPDVMLFDDIQSKECSESETLSTQLEKWLYGTAMKAKSPFGCLFIFVGNMYPTEWSILKKLKSNSRWTKFIVGGIRENGESLWEDLQPIEQLHQEFENDLAAGHPEIFFSEVLNDEHAQMNDLVDLSKLRALPYDSDDIPLGSFIIIDPSQDKKRSDNTAIGHFNLYGDTSSLMEVIEEKLSPGQTIEKTLELALRKGVTNIFVEAVAYQATLKYWLDKYIADLGIIGIQVHEIYPGHRSKPVRISSMLKAYAAGELYVDTSCRALVHSYIVRYNPLATSNVDDVLDLLTYAPKVVEEYGPMLIATSIIGQQEQAVVDRYSIQDNSPF